MPTAAAVSSPDRGPLLRAREPGRDEFDQLIFLGGAAGGTGGVGGDAPGGFLGSMTGFFVASGEGASAAGGEAPSSGGGTVPGSALGGNSNFSEAVLWSSR